MGLTPRSPRAWLLRSRFAPWAAGIAGAIALAGTQQGLSTVIHFQCRLAGAGTALAVVLPLLALVVAGIAVTAAAGGREDATRRFMAHVSIGAALLFSAPVVLQLAAALMLPPCAR